MHEDHVEQSAADEHNEPESLDLGPVSQLTKGDFAGVSIEGAGLPFRLW